MWEQIEALEEFWLDVLHGAKAVRRLRLALPFSAEKISAGAGSSFILHHLHKLTQLEELHIRGFGVCPAPMLLPANLRRLKPEHTQLMQDLDLSACPALTDVQLCCCRTDIVLPNARCRLRLEFNIGDSAAFCRASCRSSLRRCPSPHPAGWIF